MPVDQQEALTSAINNLVKALESFDTVSTQNTNIINMNDVMAKELAKKNQQVFQEYQALGVDKMGKKLTKAVDVMFQNFDIMNANIEILKAYSNEYHQRFDVLRESLTTLITEMKPRLLQS